MISDATLLPPHTYDALDRFAGAAFEYPAWSPPPGLWSDAHVGRLKALRIPKTTEVNRLLGQPDSVLYGLGRLQMLDAGFPERLARFTAGEEHLLLVNASGTGKTKLVFEALHQNWGLYFTSSSDPFVDPYGSSDLAFAIRFFDARSPCARVPLAKKPNAQPSPELVRNRIFLAQEIEILLLGRLLILERFLKGASAAGISDDDARIKWFYLQIRSADIAGLDIFDYASGELRTFSRSDVHEALGPLLEKYTRKLRFVAIDEAQALCHMYETSFASADLMQFRPLLREILACVGSNLQHSRLIACGVAVGEDIFHDAIQGSTSVIRNGRKFSSLGEFTGLEDVRKYLVHFLGHHLSSQDIELAHRYLRGRRRFLAVLVQRTLMHGIHEYIHVLDSILRAATGFVRPGSTNSRLDVRLDYIISDQALDQSSLAPQLRSAAYGHVTHCQVPVFQEDARGLVGLAMARFVDDDMDDAQIDEPIVLLTLARWLKASRAYSTSGLIRRRIRDSTTDLRGCGFSESIALYLWRQFGASGLRLTDLVSFRGRAPRWATQSAPFSLTRMAKGARTVDAIKLLDGPLVHAANEPEDVFAWFERSTSPFLVPDSDFGPQLVFILDALDGPRLVFVHLEPFTTVRPHRQREVTPRHPTTFYAANRAARKQFQTVLATFPDHSTPSRSKKTRGQVGINTLQIYAFAEVARDVDGRRPPAASLRMDVVLGDESSDDDMPRRKKRKGIVLDEYPSGDDEPASDWLELEPEQTVIPLR